MTSRYLFVALGTCLFAITLSAKQTQAEAPGASEEKTLAEFRQWANGYVREPHARVLLPDGWFEKQFDGEIGDKLAAEYAEMVKKLEGLPAVISTQRVKGQTELSVSICDTAIDLEATGLQNAALQRMKNPTPLFTIRLTKPGEPRGFSLASFVYADGRFCLAGKMSALNPHPEDLVTSILCTTPLASMEKVLQDKGLLEGTAVAHLKKVGVLK